MNNRLAAILLGAVLLATASATEANAQYPFGYFPYQAYDLFRSGSVQTDRQIPYFAQHPPVYYSMIIPRPYGQSPFPYIPLPYEPLVHTAEPLFIPNPHVPEDDAEPVPKEASSRTASLRNRPGPLVVLNPYVDQGPQMAGE